MVDNLVYHPSLKADTGATPPLADGDGDSLSNDIVLVTGENNLVLQVTEEQYIKMLSALWNGAITTYPQDFIAVVYPLIKAGKMSLCDAILACIQNTPDIQQEIAQLALSAPVATDTEENGGYLGTEIITTQAGCDNDEIFGMTTQLTDLWNQLCEDMLEIFTEIPAGFARIGDFIEAFPGLGVLPFDDILQFGEAFMDDIQTGYDSAYTVGLRNQIRCHLFCLALDNCELTMEQMRDYFYDELAETLTFDSFGEFMEDVLLLNLVGQATVWGMHLVIAQAMIFGSSILDTDVLFVYQLINTFFNDPDSDWVTLCTGCATWEKTWDFTTASGAGDGWQVGTWGDGWSDGFGWESENNDTNQELNYLYLVGLADIEIVYFTFTMSTGNPSATFISGGPDEHIVSATWLDTVRTERSRYVADGTDVNVVVACYDNPTPITVDQLGSQCNPRLGTDWFISSVTLKGVGSNPF
jgi:hypothetical protein